MLKLESPLVQIMKSVLTLHAYLNFFVKSQCATSWIAFIMARSTFRHSISYFEFLWCDFSRKYISILQCSTSICCQKLRSRYLLVRAHYRTRPTYLFNGLYYFFLFIYLMKYAHTSLLIKLCKGRCWLWPCIDSQSLKIMCSDECTWYIILHGIKYGM